MNSELFVVSVLKDSAWVDVAECANEDTASRACDQLRAFELEAHVMRLRCISANPFVERLHAKAGPRDSTGRRTWHSRSK